MNLSNKIHEINLYRAIMAKPNLPYTDLKAGKRVAVVTYGAVLDIMKVDAVGLGRPAYCVGIGVEEDAYHITLYCKKRPMWPVAVAKVCPGQASMRLSRDGSLERNGLEEVIVGLGNDAVLEGLPGLREHLGVLANYRKAHWIALGNDLKIKQLTRSEMRDIQALLP
jgi:hypothetical protein